MEQDKVINARPDTSGQGVGISNKSVTSRISSIKGTWSKTTSQTKNSTAKLRSFSTGRWIRLGVVAIVIFSFATSQLVSRVVGRSQYIAPQARLNNPIEQVQSVPVDEVVAAEVAAVVAEETDLLVTPNVANRAVTLDAQAMMVTQTENSTTPLIEKPHLVAANDQSVQNLRTVISKEGDTVASLAAQYGISEDTIRWANNLTGDLQPGTSLTILPVSGVLYTVKAGDTLASIASAHSADANQIGAFNDVEIKALEPGAQIIIPNGVKPAASVTARQSFSTSSASANYTIGGSSAQFAGNRYAYGYCTWYAYNKRAEMGRPVPSFMGNASTWAFNAQRAGFSVSRVPSVGAVFQTGSGYGGYGHVGIVESVNADGSINVSDMNYAGWNIITNRTIDASQASQYNYIH